jgi:hypothetical protein
MTGFFTKFRSKGRPGTESGEPHLVLAAFGKHPGWDDHMPGIGVETETLAYVKQTLYVGGIGRQIDSGAWEKLEPEKRVEGFDHVFLWQRGSELLLGQIWSSTDRKGRAKYPMILCVDSEGVSPQFLLEQVNAELEQLRATCQSVTTAEQVAAACQASQQRLRAPATPVESKLGPPAGVEARRRLLDHSENGPDRIGLLRILHELRMTPASNAGKSGAQSESSVGTCQLRVPDIGGANGESMAAWSAFFQAAAPKGTSVFVTHRKATNWVDVIIGEPVSDYFFCLGAGLKALPLNTQIPYDLSPELTLSLNQVESRFLGEEPTVQPVQPAPPKTPPAVKPPPPITAPPVAKAPPARTAPPVMVEKPAPPAPSPVPASPVASGPSPKNKSPFLILMVCAVVIVGAVAIWLLNANRNSKPAAAKPTAPPVASTSAAPVATVHPLEDQYNAAMNGARAALNRQDYADTVAQADAALRIKPGDPAATGVKSEAQSKIDVGPGKLEKSYQAAIQAAQAAYTQGDYTTAMAQATAALAVRAGDPIAMKLQTDAKAQSDLTKIAAGQNEQKYQAAMTSAQTALDQRDFPTALAQADAALAIKSNDAAAVQLKATAQSMKDAADLAIQHQQAFDAAMADARAALANKDYATVMAKTDEALQLRSNDAGATTLKNEAVAAQQAVTAKASQDGQYSNLISSAQSAYDGKDYTTTIAQTESALDIRPGDPMATDLRKRAMDSKDLSNAESLIKIGQFAQAKDLCLAHAGTPAFDNLAVRMKTLVAQKYNTDLEVYLVQFGLLDPRKAMSAQARNATELIGDLPNDQRDRCLNYVSFLKKTFQAAGSLDAARAKQIDDLVKAINEHS